MSASEEVVTSDDNNMMSGEEREREREGEHNSGNNSNNNIYYSSDEFDSHSGTHAVLTSRLRRKRVSRSRGGAFRDKKMKKRLYINAYSTEIDIQSVLDSIGTLNETWYSTSLSDVLYLSLTPHVKSVSGEEPAFDYSSQEVFIFEFGAVIAWGFSLRSANLKSILKLIQRSARKEPSLTIVEDEMGYVISPAIWTSTSASGMLSRYRQSQDEPTPASTSLRPRSNHRHRKNRVNDDINREVSISDEVITLHKNSTMNIRLSVSYAVAQSIIVSAFEDSVASKIQEYRYIPAVLAKEGQIKLRPSHITSMIGDLFVVKHNINLHSDVLDTPDFFWDAEDNTVCVYENVCQYLELSFRVEVLNRRLDMMRDMLEVVQAQHQSQYMTKLDWMIIWLLVLEVVVQVFGGGLMLLLKSWGDI